jgi:hypothetical protein
MSVDRLVATAEREWRSLGVQRGDRRSLGADLRSELEAAAADGLDPAELIGADPAGFARTLADEAGVRPTPARYGLVLGVAGAGAVVALVVGYGLVMGLHGVFVAIFDLPRTVHVPVWLAAGVFYGGIMAVVVVGAVLAVRLALRDLPRIRQTATRMVVLLPPAFVAAVAAAVAAGWAMDFALTPAVIGTEALIVLAAFLGATALARRWTVTTNDV